MELDRIEVKLFRAYWDDGLLDVFLGLAVLGIAIFWMGGLVALGAVAPALLIPLWGPARKRWVEPRAGLVEFSEARMARSRSSLTRAIWLGVGVFVLLLGLRLWAGPGVAGGLLGTLIPGLPAFLIAVPTLLMAVGLGLPRFLAYAAILVLCGLGVAIVGAEPWVAMLAGGTLVTLNGVRVFGRFLQLGVDEGVGE